LSFTFAFATITGALCTAGFDGLFLAIGRHLVVHLKILKNRFKNAKFQQKNEIKNLISYQIKIEKSSSDFNEFNNEVLLIQFISFIILICTLGFNIAKVVFDIL
jgi:hypothetical protein